MQKHRHKVYIENRHWNQNWTHWCMRMFGKKRQGGEANIDGDWNYFRDNEFLPDGNVYHKQQGRRYVFIFKYKSDAMLFREYGIDCTTLDKRAREVAKEYFSGLPYHPTNEARMMFKMAVV